MSENRPTSVWQEQTDKDLDLIVDEIIRLQERISCLEREQSKPDNAFWVGQLIFDVAIVAIVLITFVLR